jgi:uncharacterized protein YndB with AHSA1/START domain
MQASINQSVALSWQPDTAFSRLTADPMSWWPWNPRAVPGSRVKRVGFEHRAGGAFFEEDAGGQRRAWGEVREWDPPHRIQLAFHPPAAPETEELLELQFVPDGTGTRLTLVASDRRSPWRGVPVVRRAPRYRVIVNTILLALAHVVRVRLS